MSIDLKSPKIALGLILLAACIVYIRCLSYEFVYDDKGQIVANSAITSLTHLPEYFTTHVWANIFPDYPANYYRPLFLVWLLLNYKLFGLSPVGWHASSLIVHLLATWLVFVLARYLTSNQMVPPIAAFLFAVHPVHLESVAWISGVTDPLMTVFFVAAFVMYLKSKRVAKPSQSGSQPTEPLIYRGSFFLSVLFYTLAVLSKETAIVFVVIVFCYELLMGQGRSRWSSVLISILPYFIVTTVYLIARRVVLGGFGHQITPLPITTIIWTIPSVLWFYMDHLIWPFPLSAFYDTTYVSGGWLFWGPLVGLIVLAAFYIALARGSRVLFFLAGWVLLPILPLLNLSLFQRGEIVHDRYLYLPSVGFCIILAIAFTNVITNYAKYRTAAIALLAIIGAVWLIELFLEQAQWKSDLALYTHGAAVAPQNDLVLNNLATRLQQEGQLDRAIDLYKQVIARSPYYWLSLYNLGFCYYKLNDFNEATKYLSQSIAINPREPDQYVYYGLACLGKGDIENAENALRTAVKLRPTNARYHFALGVLLKEKADFRAAKEELGRSIVLDRAIEANARPLLAEIEAMEKLN